jgi:hypothetical protein
MRYQLLQNKHKNAALAEMLPFQNKHKNAALAEMLPWSSRDAALVVCKTNVTK